MLFLRDEKVFSLAKTAAAVPHGDITALFEEFYCYLLVAGLFREGEGLEGLHCDLARISENHFYIPGGSYREGIARFITKGLRDRFLALRQSEKLSERESSVLLSFDGIFTKDTAWYAGLSGSDILGIAAARNFSETMMTIARYVAVAFGQRDWASTLPTPRLYLSVFGNIHLSVEDFVDLSAPKLRYGATEKNGETVTALWAILSAQISTISQATFPGDLLGDMLSSFTFLGDRDEFEKSVPIPRFASSLYIQRLMMIDEYNPVPVSAAFYKDFLYGTTASMKISRRVLLNFILNLMMEKVGESHLGNLFQPNSYYKKLATIDSLYGSKPKRPAVLQFALEALDTELSKKDSSKDASLDGDDTDLAAETPTEDPQTDDGGFDPSVSPPLVPAGAPAMDKDTIDLISFDRSGEGVDEDLYRAAVVALNDKFRSDDTVPVTADVKDSLDYWVNGFLYRTAISATKDQIAFLGLQKYLKNVPTKG